MLDRETDQTEAMQALEPILHVIHGILDQSVAFYFSDAYSAAARAEHTERATANCIYSHAEKRMIESAEIVVGLNAIRLRGLAVLNYQDRALARFKKVNARGRHSNYQTKQQQDYDDQKTLPGIPEPAFRLTAGYQLDAIGSSLERIMIARPLGRTVLWTAQVTLIEGVAAWQDITPQRFGGMDGSDFDADTARARRGR
jgi:hypothetical protein